MSLGIPHSAKNQNQQLVLHHTILPSSSKSQLDQHNLHHIQLLRATAYKNSRRPPLISGMDRRRKEEIRKDRIRSKGKKATVAIPGSEFSGERVKRCRRACEPKHARCAQETRVSLRSFARAECAKTNVFRNFGTRTSRSC
ncbi:hypothetical protein PIB30_096414 [Stylosanthes scabra]|uniref:Uncharacterized protein n=1 Tax=Stylosanthes scabra TaxID=79078 RepID=A0ABU6TWW1_9FABA|nr:hypothetical protein [Stylosanthes scabra]